MIRIGNAPCSWGVLEFGLEGETAGCGRVLGEMSRAGFAGTELGDWGFLPTDPAALADTLAQYRLEMVGAFVPVALADRAAHAGGIEAAVKVARLLAAVAKAPFIVLADDNGRVPARTRKAGRIRPEDGLTAAQWTVFAAGADAVAAAVFQETGLRTVFHHHCAGYVETPAEVAALLERTDPARLGLCLDTGHWQFGGGDPLAGLRAHADRVWHVHFKDCDPAVAAASAAEGRDYFASVRGGVFCELGRGAVAFKGVVAELRAMGYDGWIVVEQDVLPGMGTPFESAVRNRAFLESLGL